MTSPNQIEEMNLVGPALTETAVPPDRAADHVVRVNGILQSIEAMNLVELRALWTTHFGPPPPLRSPELMRLMLGWRLQARTFGGLDPAVRRRLRRKTAVDAATAGLETGSSLIREWQGQRFEVLVEEGGFRWGGESYASLSAVALAITGTRWNGPRFFGLRDTKP